MITCPNCRFHSLSDVDLCPRCGARLKGVEQLQLDLGSGPSLADRAARITGPVGRLWYRITSPFSEHPNKSLPERTPWQPMWKSLLCPGWGQLSNGQPFTALKHFVIAISLLAIGITWITEKYSDFALWGGIGMILWSANSAYLGALEINSGDRMVGIRRWVGFFLIMGNFALFMWVVQYIAFGWVVVVIAFPTAWVVGEQLGRSRDGRLIAWRASVAVIAIGICVLVFGPSWMWNSIFRLHRHNQYTLEPWIDYGDRVMFESISPAWRGRRVGDIVIYDPPPYTVEMAKGTVLQGRDVYMVNPSTSMERIVALPGDTYSRREGVFYRNGRPATPLEQPLNGRFIPYDFEITIPPGHYGILYTPPGGEWIPIIGWREAPMPHHPEFVKGSVIPESDVFHRAMLVYYPRADRRWISDEAPPWAVEAPAPVASPPANAPTP